MLAFPRSRWWWFVLALLVATVRTGTSQRPEARSKANSIRSALLEEAHPTPGTNHTGTLHSAGIPKKHNVLTQVHYHAQWVRTFCSVVMTFHANISG